ncbi:MAG: hypothetical protein VZR33_04005 [Methanosphaera sp.]|nr:hypothetical protein [Methanosphaera sp.]
MLNNKEQSSLDPQGDIKVVHYDILIGTKDKDYYLARHHCIIRAKYNSYYIPDTSILPPADTSKIIIQTTKDEYAIPIHAIGAFDKIPKNKTFKIHMNI